MKYQLIKFILLLSAHTAYAGTNHNSEEKMNYLSPDEVSRDKYNVILDFKNNYDQCIINTARAELPNYHDPRQVLDTAMKQCAEKLEELNEWLIQERFPPDFRKGQLTRISRQSVRKAMPEIMFLMSTKPAAQSEPDL